MTRGELKRKIIRRKNLLNFLLGFLKSTNPIVVSLSQDLDKYIAIEQKIVLRKLKCRRVRKRKVKIFKRVA